MKKSPKHRSFSNASRLSVLIPVFNEAETVLPLFKKVVSVQLAGLSKQIIIVDDGSTDITPELLKKLKSPNVLLLRHEKNRGKGAAIRTALAHATGDIILVQDADLEYSPADYPNLLKPILEGSAKVVYGSRFLGSPQSFSFLNYIGNKLLTLTANSLYGTRLTDIETGYKVFHKDVAQKLRLEYDGFNFDPEVTAQILTLGLPIQEIPISYQARNSLHGKKITWRDGILALSCLIRYRFKKEHSAL